MYSGLHKNDTFLNSRWSTMILKRFFKITALAYIMKWIYYSGYILSVIESFAGISLLFFKTRKAAVVTLMGMHFFILLLIGPFGLHYNKVVWPWNIAMIMYLYFFFIKNEKTAAQNFDTLMAETKSFYCAGVFCLH